MDPRVVCVNNPRENVACSWKRRLDISRFEREALECWRERIMYFVVIESWEGCSYFTRNDGTAILCNRKRKHLFYIVLVADADSRMHNGYEVPKPKSQFAIWQKHKYYKQCSASVSDEWLTLLSVQQRLRYTLLLQIDQTDHHDMLLHCHCCYCNCCHHHHPLLRYHLKTVPSIKQMKMSSILHEEHIS